MGRTYSLIAGLFCGVLLCGFPLSGYSAQPVTFYLEPSLGMASVRLQSMEIETSFVSSISDDSIDIEDDWSNVDPSAVSAPVGRMAKYQGNGIALGICSGLKISGLQLGISYSWLAPDFTGYSKRYRYIPELLRAGGRKYYDSGRADFHRVLGQIKYGIPIWRLLLDFQTRIGTMIIGNTPLIFGRAVDGESAITGDVGMGLSIKANKWFAVGIQGYVGFYSFTGKYEGAFGSIMGFNGMLGIYL